MNISKQMRCSKCGSKNVEITSSAPVKGEGFFGMLRRKITDSASRPGPLAGRKCIVCKDCGHVTYIQM